MCAMMRFDLLADCNRGAAAPADGAIHDLQHAAAGEQFVFHQRDVGLDPGRVAIHQERDRAGRREHGDLRVAITVLLPSSQRADPSNCALLLSDN